MREQTGHHTVDYQPQLTRQRNKCVKHCREWDSSLILTYPTIIDSGLTYTNAYNIIFSARQHIAYMLSALYAIARPSVRPFVTW